ncbi:MAG: glucose-1-phosphate thymidylyltransferase RfbA [Nanoarchaeota archaeon]
MKGIILAGGKATRLQPATEVVSKQLMPIYDKPMIYYPLSTLMLADIKEILVISTHQDLPNFKRLLGDGSNFGVNFTYAQQDKPRGLADAFIVGREFIGKDSCCLILGDNIFHGQGLSELLRYASNKPEGGTIFAYLVKDPERSGVVELDADGSIKSIEEKPQKPKSNLAIIGLYFFDKGVVDIASKLKPSNRGELEITDVQKEYLKRGKLEAKILGRGFTWLDTGTFESLAEANIYVKTIQERQGLKIFCPEEIAYNKGWITSDKLMKRADYYNKSDYGKYLLSLIPLKQLNPDEIKNKH